MSRAREFAGLAGSADAGGITGKNLIINGAMQVAQRGSVTGVTVGYGGPDRYKFARAGAAAVTLSQDTTVPSNQGFKSSLKIDVTTADSSLAAGDYALISTRLEGQDLQHLLYGTSEAKSITLQFWVRSPKTGTHIVELYHGDVFYTNAQTYTITSADTWQKVTLTYGGYQSSGFDNDSGIGLQIAWWLASGSTYAGGTLSSNTWQNTAANRAVGQVNVMDSTSNNFYLTGVQLEVGEQATPFEHRSIGDELIRCQRYYVRHTGGSTNLSGLSTGVIYSSTAALTAHTYITPMRSSPTIGTDSLNAVTQMQVVRGGAASAVSALDAYGDTLGARIDCTITSGTTGQGAYLQIMTGYVDFDAEL